MTDEERIRELLASWHRATSSGDLEELLSLVAEDAVFLSAGQAALVGREEFAAHLRAAMDHVCMQPRGHVEEIRIFGDVAYCWSTVELKVTPRDSTPSFLLTGPDLTILKKEAGERWVVFRAASMLVPARVPAG